MSRLIRFPVIEDVDDPVALADLAQVEIYTVPQAATLLGISAGLAYELVRTGEIPAKRLGRRWIVPRARFHAWLNDLPKGA
jgi:excisionase family DNA binding protein